MKKEKIITLITALGLSLAGIATVAVRPEQTIQAAVAGNKYGLVKRYTLPQSLRGIWYTQVSNMSPMKITKHSFSRPGTNGKKLYAVVYVVGKVKGTNKYPWQMTGKFDKYYEKAMRVEKTRKMRGLKWTVIGPVDDHVPKMATAYTMHEENIDGQTVKVVFEADYTGKVVNQYFTTLELAQKYGKQKFTDMTYFNLDKLPQ
ncbi:hypothetical protein [Lactobacillus bombicola]|nr:hypothetical protein [Lactobacillus bombicola]RHW51689.1 hypothetical protein DS833_02550 [Lactobacillus bombicola]